MCVCVCVCLYGDASSPHPAAVLGRQLREVVRAYYGKINMHVADALALREQRRRTDAAVTGGVVIAGLGLATRVDSPLAAGTVTGFSGKLVDTPCSSWAADCRPVV